MEVCSYSSGRWTWVVVSVVLLQYCVLGLESNNAVVRYRLQTATKTGCGLSLSLVLDTGIAPLYSEDSTNLLLDVRFEEPDRIRLRVTDPAKPSRWAVPDAFVPGASLSSCSCSVRNESCVDLSNFRVAHNPVGNLLQLNITRKDNGLRVFSLFSLIFEDQYLSLGTWLPSKYSNVYGLGERVHSFLLKKPFRYTMFNADHWNLPDVNLYGSHPFALVHDRVSSFGLFLLNSNAMDAMLEVDSLEFRTIGGVLDLFVFGGSSPEAVIQQYHAVVGNPHLPPLWALGWHQSRNGYKSLQEVEWVVANYSAHNIPLDVIFNDIDYMDNHKDFTIDSSKYPLAQYQKFVESLHDAGKKYVVIVDPGIAKDPNYPPYADGLRRNIFVKRPWDMQPIIGSSWAGEEVFPDFSSPEGKQFWTDHLVGFLKTVVPADGIWIDMNEPASNCIYECGSVHVTKMPYTPGLVPLDVGTVGLGAVLNLSTMYNLHNAFGLLETQATYEALSSYRGGSRPFVLTRSSFAGSGRYAAKWTGDNNSSFFSMRTSIAGILNLNMFGFSLVGSDICGFLMDTSFELCMRWTSLGTFYPFSRNHNDAGRKSQEPYVFGQPMIFLATKMIQNKYRLSAYWYTLMLRASQRGGTVVRPLFFEFPSDASTFAIDAQFMIGSALLVSPVLSEGVNFIDVYLPAQDGGWYDYWTGRALGSSTGHVRVACGIDCIPVHVRAGSIIPLQSPGQNILDTRKSPLSLLVVLNNAGAASGDLVLDDGLSAGTIDSGAFSEWSLSAAAQSVTILPIKTGYRPEASLLFAALEVWGLQAKAVSSVSLNGEAVSSFVFDSFTNILLVDSLKADLLQPIVLSWQ